MLVKKLLCAALLAAASAASPAFAGICFHPVATAVVVSAPVYYARPAVYYARPAVYYAPAPVYYARPAYVSVAVPYYHHHCFHPW
jgi:hypothetical protein